MVDPIYNRNPTLDPTLAYDVPSGGFSHECDAGDAERCERSEVKVEKAPSQLDEEGHGHRRTSGGTFKNKEGK